VCVREKKKKIYFLIYLKDFIKVFIKKNHILIDFLGGVYALFLRFYSTESNVTPLLSRFSVGIQLLIKVELVKEGLFLLLVFSVTGAST
jgi:hypothetical protein